MASRLSQEKAPVDSHWAWNFYRAFISQTIFLFSDLTYTGHWAQATQGAGEGWGLRIEGLWSGQLRVQAPALGVESKDYRSDDWKTRDWEFRANGRGLRGEEPGAETSEVRGPGRTGTGRPWTGTIMWGQV